MKVQITLQLENTDNDKLKSGFKQMTETLTAELNKMDDTERAKYGLLTFVKSRQARTIPDSLDVLMLGAIYHNTLTIEAKEPISSIQITA